MPTNTLVRSIYPHPYVVIRLDRASPTPLQVNHLMSFDTLLRRNSAFVGLGFNPQLRMMPAGKMLIIGCVDPRVDPMDIFKLVPGEAAIYRNIGGRVNPALLETLALLRTVAQAAGGDVGPGSNLIVLHHTDCGINQCAGATRLRLNCPSASTVSGMMLSVAPDKWKSFQVAAL